MEQSRYSLIHEEGGVRGVGRGGGGEGGGKRRRRR
jgi:hypothetical protein